MTAFTAIVLAALTISHHVFFASPTDDFHRVPSDPRNVAEQMAMDYTAALDTLADLLDQPITLSPSSTTASDDSQNARVRKMLISKGKDAFETALRVFPDDSLPHAHVLFAKLFTKVGSHRESLPLFDEAIRRASLPLNDNADATIVDAADAREDMESLVEQLILERTRSRFLLLENEVSEWDDANNRLHRGGIPPETSPFVPLISAEEQLRLFPDHPQVLHGKASLLVLSLDAPASGDGDELANNSTARAWEAFDTFRKAQASAYEAFVYGKTQGLAGGKPCKRGSNDSGLFVGGGAWNNAPGSSGTPFSYNKTAVGDDENGSYMGIITLQNILISGRDAVLSGYGTDCHVYVPHPYVNLANGLPMVTSWEADATTTRDDARPESPTHVPEGNNGAYGGRVASRNHGLMIPDPKRSPRGTFHSALLLTGYAAHNYYHFVSEILPALAATRKYARGVLEKGNEKHVVIIPNLQHEFVEGFFRLLLPEAVMGGNELSPQIVQWGPNRQPTSDGGDEDVPFASLHPIAHVRQLVSVAWDQPAQAPPPLGGPPHCLTPAPLLRATRRMAWKAVDAMKDTANDQINGKLKVVYCSRSSSPTRRLREEEELLSRIRNEIREKDLGAEVIVFEKNTDESSKNQSPLDFVVETIELFRSATVVVGVHGASLANIAFANIGTTVVEMGLEGLSQASHYRHLSQALELNHAGVFLAKDARSLGATEVTLRDGGLQLVVNAVADGLKREKGDRTAGRSEL